MKLVISGTTDQIMEILKKEGLTLAVFDAAAQEFHVHLDSDGHSCVCEKMEVPAEPKKPGPKFNHPPVVEPALPTATATGRVKNTYRKEKNCLVCDEKFIATHPKTVACPTCIAKFGRHVKEHYRTSVPVATTDEPVGEGGSIGDGRHTPAQS